MHSPGPESDDGSIDGDLFTFLVNGEAQYSLWPAAQPVPAGWAVAFEKNTQRDCLAYVEAHWTDMRPRSLRAPAPEPVATTQSFSG